MSHPSVHEATKAPRSLVIAAFAAIYVFWGSTYLGIRFAIETIPPFLMAGSRFFIAGILLYGLARWRSHERPTLRQWRDAAIVGCMLLGVGNGSVTYVEQKVPSTIAALIVSLTPVWMVVIDWLRGGPRPGGWTQLGLLLGISGVAFIVTPTDGTSFSSDQIAGILILLAASLSWSYGSVWSRHADKPASPFLTVGMQMTASGLGLLLVGLAGGEGPRFDPSAISTKSLIAWFYLLVAGSLIGFTAYIWLLHVTTTARVATHSYVNPIIAVLLGVWLGNESISTHAALGGGLVVLAVVLILRTPKTRLSNDALEPPALPTGRSTVRPAER